MDPERRLSWLGGVSAFLIALTLLASLVSIPFALPAARSWLVVLFVFNAGLGGLPAEPLRLLNALDFAILVLAGLAFLGLWSALTKRQRIWLGIAVGMSFAGIAVLLITHLAGRSALMGSGFIVSVLMVLHRTFRRLGVLGVFANGVLFAGDLATGTSPSAVAAGLVGVGYLLVLAWFFGLSATFLRTSATPAHLAPGDSPPHPTS